LLLAIAMAVGGQSGSTAGGIKLNRIGFILKAIVVRVKETLSPDSARVIVDFYHLGRRRLTSGDAEEAMTIFMLYAVTYTLGAFAGIVAGYDALQSIYESVCMASNGGVIVGIAAPGMPLGLELVYILEMWAGRLEFVTLLALVVKIAVSCVPKRKGQGA
jgi:trk system potassium uptake protein